MTASPRGWAASPCWSASCSWAAMLRPALWVTEEHLVMRNLADTVRIRLAAVEELAVRQVLAVRAGDRRLVSTVLGRTWRKAMMTRGAPSSTPESEDGPHEGMRYVDWAEHRLRELVDAARDRAGVAAGSEEQRALPGAVRREPALLPLALIGVAAVLMAVEPLPLISSGTRCSRPSSTSASPKSNSSP